MIEAPGDAYSITWHSFDLRTGRRGQQVTVKDLVSFGRIIGEPTEVSGLAVQCYNAARDPMAGGLPTAAGAVPGWEAATLPGRVMLVAVDADDKPLWAGMILRRRSDSSAWVRLDLVTLEGYFDRRFVTDHTFTRVPQGAIVEAIITGDVTPTGVQFVVDADSAMLRDRTYSDDDDKTALSILQELMGVQGGPEFTVDLEWTDETHTVLALVVRVRDRIGKSPTLPVQLVMPGPVTDFGFVEDYTSENGANDVMATSSGEGDVRPESSHQVADELLAAGWAKFEHRFTPSTSITETSTLDAHAAAKAAQMRAGLNELIIDVHLDTGPRIGSDFHLGDDVTAVLTCPRFPAQTGPDGNLVPGYTHTLRCTGWEIDLVARRLKPRLLEVT